ncbi:MAG: chemotaxis protein CheW [Anaerolineae bacterium]|nr:chemotaxis protein CheW [Anaerolineae bacterium]
MSHQADSRPVLIFNIGDGLYALSIDDIVEVAAMVEMTAVPDAPPEILGVVNRHGAILPMLDLRRVFKQQSAAVLPSTLFIVVQQGNNRAGLVVDDVQQVEYVDAAQLEGVSVPGRYIRGMISYKSQLIQQIALPPLWESFLVNQVAEKQG